MIATEIDSQWFHNNPDREFRLRHQPPAEFQAWPVPPEPGMVAWCLSRAFWKPGEEMSPRSSDAKPAWMSVSPPRIGFGR
ncbi:MAG: hypothetical protein DI590_11330 [Methylorubrum populi]|nr:MAG: hypothetical protein DI590_11330 [Methylorubrum populi]